MIQSALACPVSARDLTGETLLPLRIRLRGETTATGDLQERLRRVGVGASLDPNRTLSVTVTLSDALLLGLGAELPGVLGDTYPPLERNPKALRRRLRALQRLMGRHGQTWCRAAEELSPLLAGRPRVLVVDDHEGIRLGVRRGFRQSGYAVLTAASGEEALELAREWNPELVLLDLELPGISGLDTARRLSMLGGTSPVLIAFSASHTALAEARVQGLFAAALQKPVPLDRLLSTLESHLGRHSSRPSTLQAPGRMPRQIDCTGSAGPPWRSLHAERGSAR